MSLVEDDVGPVEDDVKDEVKLLRKAAASLPIFDLQFWCVDVQWILWDARARPSCLVGQALRVLVGPRLGLVDHAWGPGSGVSFLPQYPTSPGFAALG